MRNTELYPELHHNRALMKRLTAFFAVQPAVYEVAVFGSLAADLADRWSEVDLIVVTAYMGDQLPVFARLRGTLAVVYHRPFMRDTHVPGAYVSAMLLAGESPFHLVNLHFLSLAERANPSALERYRGLRQLHRMLTVPWPPVPTTYDPVPNEAETVDEARVYAATNTLRRMLRQVLRRQVAPADLGVPVAALRGLLADYPDGLPTAHGDVCAVAARYLDMAALAMKAEYEAYD